MNRKNMFLISLYFCLLLLVSIPACAKTATATASGNWVTGELTDDNTVDTYKVTLPTDGWLTVTFQGGTINTAIIRIQNNDETEEYYADDIQRSNATSPKTVTGTRALSAGTYTVRVNRYAAYSSGLKFTNGTYRFKLTFEAANNNEREPNNSFAEAMSLSRGQKVTGFLPRTDIYDYYKLTLTKKSTVKISCTTMFYSWLILWDEDYIQLKQVSGNISASETSPKIVSYEATLEPGTYYFRPTTGSNHNQDYGRYIIEWNVTSCDSHTPVTTVKKATTSANGSLVKTCSVCGQTISTETIYSPSSVKLSYTAAAYNGKVKKPSVTVTDSKGNKISSSYYTVKYAKGRKNVGTYKVTVQFKNRYSGTLSKTFVINPKATSITKVTGKSKAFALKLKKVTGQTTGYQIQYSISKSFSNAVTKTLKNTKTSVTYKKLRSRTRYYIRVRTYKTVSGKTYYSAWSKVKSVRTK